MAELLNAKGTKDLAPEQKILKNYVVERHGFSPMETPTIERQDILTAKYAGGTEILKEIFSLSDQGKRKLALRYDLTVPLARFMGMNSQMKLPFKRYMVGNVFRDGPVATARLREFTQCDIDIVGSALMLADAECIKVAQQFFRAVGLEVTIEVNNRKILDGIMASLKIPKDKHLDVILAIDKIKKIPLKEIKKEIEGKGIPKKQIESLFKALEAAKTNKEEIERLRNLMTDENGNEGLDEMEELLSYVDNDNVSFSVSLARGLAYYTGTVFEIFLTNGTFKSSLTAGGRYDNMINEFLGNPKNRSYPAVGISFGIDRICHVLLSAFQFSKKSVTDVFVIPIGTLQQSLDVVNKLRAAEINTDVDLMKRGMSKNIKYADSLGIPYVLIIGENEVNAGKYTLKALDTGKEEKLPITKIIKKLKS
jgi:histidyl-tRNA synthetase